MCGGDAGLWIETVYWELCAVSTWLVDCVRDTEYTMIADSRSGGHAYFPTDGTDVVHARRWLDFGSFEMVGVILLLCVTGVGGRDKSREGFQR